MIIAELTIDEPDFANFVEGTQVNSATSLAVEPGMLHFEIVPDKERSVVRLVEGYLTREDFERHLQTRHFLAWKERCFPLIRRRFTSHFEMSKRIEEPTSAAS
jgi:quinol monooxygenase YgiN